MRTVLYGIHLLIDKVEIHNRVFISKQFMRGERARQWRDRKRESVRGSALLEMRDRVGNKIES
jgi:hypothetical protein